MARSIKGLILLAALAALAGGCSRENKEDVLYRIGNGAITQEDVDRIWTGFPPDAQIQYMDRSGRQTLLDNLVTVELLYQESMREKLDQDPDLKFELERSRKNLLAQQVIEKSIRLEDLYTFYQANYIRIDAIDFPVDNPGNAAEKSAAGAKALAVHQSLQKGAEFGQLKARHAKSAAGGDLGYMSRDKVINIFGAEAATEIFAVKKDAPQRFTKPVFTRLGWHIFYVLEFPQNLDTKGYDLVWVEIMDSKREEVFRGVINDLRGRIPVKPNQEAVEGFLKRGDDWKKRQAQPAPVPADKTAPAAPAPEGAVKPAPNPGSTAKPLEPAPGQ